MESTLPDVYSDILILSFKNSPFSNMKNKTDKSGENIFKIMLELH